MRKLNVDIFQMADNVIRRQKTLKNGLPMEKCLKIFGVSKSGYYSWRKRKEEESEKAIERRQELSRIMGCFREIVKKLGFVPGKRTFRAYMFRDYEMNVSVKRCAKIMKLMNLVANRPKKDAYKGQASHDHQCAAPGNKVDREFYIGPRKVILTDITYFYYGRNRSPLYLCVFKDAYTKEILGKAAGTDMTTALVRRAYDCMMDKYGKQLKKNTEVYIHSDQGSQYLSTSFKELLENDGFIQSVSRRGNSQDNAPMESFFGRMKCYIIDLVALCPDAKTAIRMVEGYIDEYNDSHYQYSLAGLTPSEYYIYVTEGIYPCDNYYGVKATELMPVSELVTARLEAAAKKEARARERSRKKREKAERLLKAPEQIVRRDQAILRRERKKWEVSMELAVQQIAYINDVLSKTQVALMFLLTASEETLEELRYPQNWKKYVELDYIFMMNGLF